VNGPRSVVVSGDQDAVTELVGRFRERGRRTKALRVSHAFHSPQIADILAEFGQVLRGTRLHDPALPIISNVTGALAEPGELSRPDYWLRHAREAVRFADCVRAAHDQGVTEFLELGADGALSAAVRDCLPDVDVLATPILRPDRPERATLLEAVSRLHVRGAAPDWAEVFAGTPAARVDLPTYAFDHQRYWLSRAEPVTSQW